MFTFRNEIKDEDNLVILTYTEGDPYVSLHAMIRCGPDYNEGVGIVLSPVMLVELRDAVQVVLDAMSVQEEEE